MGWESLLTAGIEPLNTGASKQSDMGMELERECPNCGETGFWRTASMMIHIGEKVKWSCNECGYGFVTIDETVDTATA